MAAWLRRQRHWLVVEPLPGYAPDLNPVEALWSNLKGVELANLAGDTLVGCQKSIRAVTSRSRLTEGYDASSLACLAAGGLVWSGRSSIWRCGTALS
jgi:hypothetical protein